MFSKLSVCRTFQAFAFTVDAYTDLILNFSSAILLIWLLLMGNGYTEFHQLRDMKSECNFTKLLCNDSRLLSEDKVIILNIANEIRNRVASGSFQYLNIQHNAVSNMNKLHWNETLANKATEIVSSCPHSTPSFIDEQTTIELNENGIEHIKIVKFIDPSTYKTDDGVRECEVSSISYDEKLTRCAPQKIKERIIRLLAEGGLSTEGRKYDIRDFWILNRYGEPKLTFRRPESSDLGCSFMIRTSKTHYHAYLTCIHCFFNVTLPVIGLPGESCQPKFSKLDPKYKHLCSDLKSEYDNIEPDSTAVVCDDAWISTSPPTWDDSDISTNESSPMTIRNTTGSTFSTPKTAGSIGSTLPITVNLTTGSPISIPTNTLGITVNDITLPYVITSSCKTVIVPRNTSIQMTTESSSLRTTAKSFPAVTDFTPVQTTPAMIPTSGPPLITVASSSGTTIPSAYKTGQSTKSMSTTIFTKVPSHISTTDILNPRPDFSEATVTPGVFDMMTTLNGLIKSGPLTSTAPVPTKLLTMPTRTETTPIITTTTKIPFVSRLPSSISTVNSSSEYPITGGTIFSQSQSPFSLLTKSSLSSPIFSPSPLLSPNLSFNVSNAPTTKDTMPTNSSNITKILTWRPTMADKSSMAGETSTFKTVKVTKSSSAARLILKLVSKSSVMLNATLPSINISTNETMLTSSTPSPNKTISTNKYATAPVVTTVADTTIESRGSSTSTFKTITTTRTRSTTTPISTAPPITTCKTTIRTTKPPTTTMSPTTSIITATSISKALSCTTCKTTIPTTPSIATTVTTSTIPSSTASETIIPPDSINTTTTAFTTANSTTTPSTTTCRTSIPNTTPPTTIEVSTTPMIKTTPSASTAFSTPTAYKTTTLPTPSTTITTPFATTTASTNPSRSTWKTTIQKREPTFTRAQSTTLITITTALITPLTTTCKTTIPATETSTITMPSTIKPLMSASVKILSTEQPVLLSSESSSSSIVESTATTMDSLCSTNSNYRTTIPSPPQNLSTSQNTTIATITLSTISEENQTMLSSDTSFNATAQPMVTATKNITSPPIFKPKPCLCINWYLICLIFSIAFLFAWCLLCWQKMFL